MNKKLFTSALAGAIAVSASNTASAQDDCSTAVAISGFGVTVWDNTLATTSGFDGGDPVTCTTGNGVLNSDVFYQWTATASGDTRISLGGSAIDTALAVHLGTGCAAICTFFDDDALGFPPGESALTIPGVTSGDTYLLQIGGWTATDLTAAGVLDINPPPPAPANNDCSTPDVISGFGAFTYDTTAATTSGFDGGDPVTCATAGGTQMETDVFFAWTATASGDVRFDTFGTVALGAGDSLLAVHAGADCTATCVAFGDDGLIGTDFFVDVPGVVSGAQYLVQCGNWTGADNGPGVLNIGTPPLGPANDDCSAPTAISGLGTFSWDSTNATNSGFDGGDPVLCAPAFDGGGNDVPPNQDIFYAWTAAAAGDRLFSLCGTGTGDTAMTMHLGADCSAVCTAANDDSTCGFLSEITILGVNTGDTYLIQIGEWALGTGLAGGFLDISVATPPPANNDCSAAIAISGLGTTIFDNQFATTSGFDGGDPVTCATAGGPGITADVFYQWTAAAAGDRRFSTAGSGVDTTLSLHLGTGCAAVCSLFDDDTAGNFESRIDVFGVAAGDTYLVQIGGWDAASVTAAGILDVSVPPAPPANDDCSTPTSISGEGVFTYDNTAATTSGFDGGDPVTCTSSFNGNPPQLDLFYVWTAPCDGTFQVDTCNAGGDTNINVHTGSDCTAVCLIGNDDGGVCAGLESEVQFVATGGQDYLIQIGSFGTFSTSTGVFNITNLTGPCGPSGGISIACSPPLPHYLGGLATCAASSLGAATPSGLHLECTDGPDGEFGFFLVAAGSSLSLNIFNGILCLDAPQGRYNPLVATNQGQPTLNAVGQFDSAGVLQSLFGNAASSGGSGFDVPLELPFSPAGQSIQPGDTWHFQCWYRDQVGMPPVPGSSANFSDVAVVTFP